MIFADTYATPSSPTFITCNASINADNYGQWQIFRHAISPISANDHDHYIKFSTYRSYSYIDPSIPSPRRHLCKVYTVLLLLREKDHFPNPQNTHTETPGQYTDNYSLRGPSIHYTGSYHLLVLPSIPLADSRARGF